MEQETHTRWIFPGAFAVGTFLSLMYVFNDTLLGHMFKNWQAVLPILLGIPAIGFLAHRIVYFLAGGYSGWGRDGVRKDLKNAFLKSPIILSLFQKNLSLFQKIVNMDSDIIFSVVAFTGLTANCDREMPEAFQQNARRRWTVVWASWNCACGVIFGSIAFIIHVSKSNSGNWFGIGLLIPIVLFFGFYQIGRRARRDAWDMELLWVTKARLLERLLQEGDPEVED
jgi:hypothetical protein